MDNNQPNRIDYDDNQIQGFERFPFLPIGPGGCWDDDYESEAEVLIVIGNHAIVEYGDPGCWMMVSTSLLPRW